MKIISKILLAMLLGVFIPGCVSHAPVAQKPLDKNLEAPSEVQSHTGPEIHGYISTTIGGRIK